MNFFFGDIVVVDEDNIGVVVKSWNSYKGGKRHIKHEVYVRTYNMIKEYPESEMQRYGVRHKYLSDEEKQYQRNAMESL